ncbi:hypothetical protein OG564_44220 [Streptomyces sp. NBC_01280]|uniref:hypothetical protein n=1 Tax=Streptomyces sp. NBC_01280 TaxID=2903810 RepID=UPI002E30109B|nr:hypothetical protein [Streptomyces sp. NBC_01280]
MGEGQFGGLAHVAIGVVEVPVQLLDGSSRVTGGHGFLVPIVKCLVTDGSWITGQTIFANGGYTVR